MPVYLYRHPKTQKVIEVVQKMTDTHEFTDEKGVKYERVFVAPQTAIDTKVDPFSKNDFLKRTNKRMTVGQMMDESAELSEKRAKKTGVDPIKKKIYDSYKKNTGKDHPDLKGKRKIETSNYVFEY